uniref:Uncharacterized protein n=1 Tax=Solanum lycopersicum TaxID=4081 RepID=A0A3Q7I5E2_SOLLC
MPRTTLGTNFNLCFTKLKRSLPLRSIDDNDNDNDNERHQQQHHSMHFCNSVKNFNSLYDLSSSECNIPTSSSTDESDYNYELENNTPDLATIYASQRFFFSSPGHSNSIIDSSSSISSSIASTSSSVGSDAPLEGASRFQRIHPTRIWIFDDRCKKWWRHVD